MDVRLVLRVSLFYLDQTRIKWLVLEVYVVLLCVFLCYVHKLHSDKLVALSFETTNDLTDETSLYSVRLDGDECPLGV